MDANRINMLSGMPDDVIGKGLEFRVVCEKHTECKQIYAACYCIAEYFILE